MYISSGHNLKYRNRFLFIFVVADSVDLYEMLCGISSGFLMFVKVLIYQGVTLLCKKTVAKTGLCTQQTSKCKIGFVIEIHDMIPSKVQNASWGPLFYTLGTDGLKHHPSSAFCRSRPWQNLIDVAELDWDVTQRERSQLTVADREETYTHPWQTLGVNVVRRRVSGIQLPTVRH